MRESGLAMMTPLVQGALKLQRDTSLLESNLTSAGVLAPMALRTTGFPGLGVNPG
jgi:hypothetical protein